jgi:hypothetical protein
VCNCSVCQVPHFYVILSSKLADVLCLYIHVLCIVFHVPGILLSHSKLKKNFLMAAVLFYDLQKCSQQKLRVVPITIGVGSLQFVCVCGRVRTE